LGDCWIAAAEIFSRRRLLSAMQHASDSFARARASVNKFVRPRPAPEIIIPPSDSWSSLTHAPCSTIRTSPYNRSESLRTLSPSPMAPASPEAPLSGHNVPEEVFSANGDTQASAMPARRARFVQAMRSVIMAQHPSGVSRASIFSPEIMRQEELRGLIRSSRVARLAPKLRDFAPTQEFDAHQALVRHLQFSPNGNFLATSRFGII
jgi:WD repeat-containing protein 26